MQSYDKTSPYQQWVLSGNQLCSSTQPNRVLQLKPASVFSSATVVAIDNLVPANQHLWFFEYVPHQRVSLKFVDWLSLLREKLLLGHHELRPSSGPVLNSYYSVCCQHKLWCMYVVSSLCPVYFSLTSHTAPPVHNTGHPISADPYRPGVSRPVMSRSYRHSGRTDSIHRCCYECCQCLQFIKDNAKPSINSLHLCCTSGSPYLLIFL